MMSPYDTVYIEHGRMRDITIIDNHTIGIDRGAYVEIFIKNDKLPADMVSEIERSVETAFRPNHNKNTQYIMPTSATTGNSHIWIWVAVPIVLLIISLYIRYKVRGKRNQPSSMDGNTGTIMEDRHSEQAFIHSDYYLTEKFKKETGQSIHQYIKKARINRAKMLLLSTNQSIQQIADHLAFATPNYFIRCFREEEGVTPAQFRKQK